MDVDERSEEELGWGVIAVLCERLMGVLLLGVGADDLWRAAGEDSREESGREATGGAERW